MSQTFHVLKLQRNKQVVYFEISV